MVRETKGKELEERGLRDPEQTRWMLTRRPVASAETSPPGYVSRLLKKLAQGTWPLEGTGLSPE